MPPQHQPSYSRKPALRNLSPSFAAGTRQKALLDPGPLRARAVSLATSPAVSRATQNAGLTLYELVSLMDLIRVAYEKGELASVEARLIHLLSEAAGLTATVTNILTLARIESEQSEAAPRSFDIVALLREVAETARMIIGDKPVTLMDVSCPSPVVIYSDPVIIHHVMTELVSNAAKFTDRGRIALILNKADNTVRLTVADTGRGMSGDLIAALFEASDRGCDLERDDVESAGLGLRIVRSFVKKLNGQLSVSSKLDEGTIIEVSFPLDSVKR
jgi:signal transduction histidine kinase